MKGRRPTAPEGKTPNTMYKTGDWVVLHNGAIVFVEEGGILNCIVRVIFTDDDPATFIRKAINTSSILSKVDADTAKAMLLLQGVEL